MYLQILLFRSLLFSAALRTSQEFAFHITPQNHFQKLTNILTTNSFFFAFHYPFFPTHLYFTTLFIYFFLPLFLSFYLFILKSFERIFYFSLYTPKSKYIRYEKNKTNKMLNIFVFQDLWAPEPCDFFQEGARIEAGFRKYFHRAEPTQVASSYILHHNKEIVIRLFWWIIQYRFSYMHVFNYQTKNVVKSDIHVGQNILGHWTSNVILTILYICGDCLIKYLMFIIEIQD